MSGCHGESWLYASAFRERHSLCMLMPMMCVPGNAVKQDPKYFNGRHRKQINRKVLRVLRPHV
ncbi:hypothetical protein WG66_014892 [Moniliophthora roreri]|nr:hypothetical protein WG66_014892 [Moniliophthora roreri]